MIKEVVLHHDILKPVAFYPYTSVVLAPMLGIWYETSDEIHQLHCELVEFFEAGGVKAWMDNKVVFELEDKLIPNRKIFIGFYDNKMHIGFGAKTYK